MKLMPLAWAVLVGTVFAIFANRVYDNTGAAVLVGLALGVSQGLGMWRLRRRRSNGEESISRFERVNGA